MAVYRALNARSAILDIFITILPRAKACLSTLTLLGQRVAPFRDRYASSLFRSRRVFSHMGNTSHHKQWAFGRDLSEPCGPDKTKIQMSAATV
jgi:hypothetical protein